MTVLHGSLKATDTSYLFPHFVCRVTGLPVRHIEDMRSTRLAEMCALIQRAKDHIVATALTLEQYVFALAGSVNDRKQKNNLLQLKRDIHNLRPSSVACNDDLRSLFEEKAMCDIDNLFSALEKRDRLLEEFDRVFAVELAKTREAFRKSIEHPDFQKGLLISSQSLFAAAKNYLSNDCSNLNGRNEQVERGLLRYFTRMAMKTTPFGTFCALIPGTIGFDGPDHSDDKEILRIDGAVEPKTSYVRINKSLYGVLVNHLKSRPAVRARLTVELNPTVENRRNTFRFLSLVNRQEVFQHLQINDALALMHATLSEHSCISHGQLVEILCGNSRLETSTEEATSYVDKLLELGFLRFRMGIADQEADWDLPLTKMLDTIEDEHAGNISALLGKLRGICDRLPATSVEDRPALIESGLSLIDSSFKEMNILPNSHVVLPFYEDATCDARVSLPPRVLDPLISRLKRLVCLTARIAVPRAEQASMRHFFDSFYGDQKDSVPLLQFYEDYYREHLKAHLEKSQRLRNGIKDEEVRKYDVGNPFGLEVVRHIGSAHRAITDLVRKRWIEDRLADEIRIDGQELAEIAKDVEEPGTVCRSVSVFAQLVPPKGDHRGHRLYVQNAYYNLGFGKYFSRFLYLLPGALDRHLLRDNESLSKDRMAEVCGDADFNANLHPQLLGWDISYPTGESNSTRQQIACNDIQVERDLNDAHNLILRQITTGAKVVPIDLGFLNPQMRPPLFQLLTQFTPASIFSVHLPDAITDISQASRTQDKSGEPSDQSQREPVVVRPEILYRPRVVLDGCMVISRKRWSVPQSLFPIRLPNESTSRYYLRVQAWRHEHGIPDEVFIRVQPIPEVRGSVPSPPSENRIVQDDHERSERRGSAKVSDSAEKAGPTRKETTPVQQNKSVSRDIHKPQYVDFNNPLLVDLFGHTHGNHGRFSVTLEERLPSTGQLFWAGKDQLVTEFIFQINFPEAKCGAAGSGQLLVEVEEDHGY